MSDRSAIHETSGFSERIAESVTHGLGSMPFIAIQTVIVLCWISVNFIAWRLRFDPFPFILLNLAFSTQAAYAAPFILLAGNRAAVKDRLRDDLEAEETSTVLTLVQAIHGMASEIRQMDQMMVPHVALQNAQMDKLDLILSNVQTLAGGTGEKQQ